MDNISDINLLIDAVKNEKVLVLQSYIVRLKSNPANSFPNTILADLTTYSNTLVNSGKLPTLAYRDYVSSALNVYFWIVILYFIFAVAMLFSVEFSYVSGILLGTGAAALITYFLLKSHYENQFKQARYLDAILRVLCNSINADTASKINEQKAYLIKELKEWRDHKNLTT